MRVRKKKDKKDEEEEMIAGGCVRVALKREEENFEFIMLCEREDHKA